MKLERIKNVFKLLIEEADYMIDDRTHEKCQGVSKKQEFAMKIDSIRKSLGVDSMEDVELLVDIFYSFEDQYQKEQDAVYQKQMADIEAEAAEQGISLQPMEQQPQHNHSSNAQPAPQRQGTAPETEKDHTLDPYYLNLSPDNIVFALDEFHRQQEQNIINNQLLNIAPKKKTSYESEE